MARNTASLSSLAIVAKKGEAAPAAAHHEPAAKKAKPAAEAGYYKALTVKLDRDRYEALKTLGVRIDKTSQEIFVEALDLYLQQKR